MNRTATTAVRRTGAFLVCSLWATGIAWGQFEIETRHTNLDPAAAPTDKVNPGKVGPQEIGIDPALLGTIRHRTLRVRDTEVDAFYNVLEHARAVDYTLQKRVAAENVRRFEAEFRAKPANKRLRFSLFVDLFTQPERYTGQLVTMQGYVRKNIRTPDDPDDPDPVPTYEAWLFSPDSQHNPVCVIYLDAPEGMPVGGDMVESVEVTGYFFKLYGYRAQDAPRAAPMLLAKTIEWKPRAIRDRPADRNWYFVVTGSAVLGVIIIFWILNGRQHRKLQRKVLEPEGFDPNSPQAFQIPDTPESPVHPPANPLTSETHKYDR